MADFCITGYPRSRTAWFSAFMSCGDVFCYHENKIFNSNAKYIGFSGSNFSIQPIECKKLIIIERNVDDVRSSLRKLTPLVDIIIEKIDLSKLDGLRIKYNDINHKLKEIWEYCVPEPFPEERAKLFINMKIEQNYSYLQ